MKPFHPITCITIIGVLLIHLLTGFLVSGSAKLFVKFYAALLGGRPLPALTDLVLSYGSSSWPAIVGLILGLVFAALLGYLDKREKGFLAPLVLTVVLMENFLTLGIYLIAVGLPAVSCTTCLSQ